MSLSALSDESLRSYYESIRKEVEADRELRRRGHKHFLTNSDAIKKYAASLREEMVRGRLSYSPIAWLWSGIAELPDGTPEPRGTGRHKKSRDPSGHRGFCVSRIKKGYLVSFFIPSFDMSPFMLSSDFVLFFVLEVFFILALASIGLSVFMDSWAAGPVV
jgi:hypothetical protein